MLVPSSFAEASADKSALAGDSLNRADVAKPHVVTVQAYPRADVAGHAPGPSPRYEDPGLRTLAAKRCR